MKKWILTFVENWPFIMTYPILYLRSITNGYILQNYVQEINVEKRKPWHVELKVPCSINTEKDIFVYRKKQKGSFNKCYHPIVRYFDHPASHCHPPLYTWPHRCEPAVKSHTVLTLLKSPQTFNFNPHSLHASNMTPFIQ